MITQLIDLLKNANGETENIQIAQGKNKLPENLKEAIQQIKNETRWALRKQ